MLQRKPSGDPTRAIDLEIEGLYERELQRALGPVRVYSEESGWIGERDNYKYTAFVDPIDGTEMTTRQIMLFSTAISVLGQDGQLLFSAVGDVSTGRVYWANSVAAFVDATRVTVPPPRALADAFLANYSMSPERMHHPERIRELLQACGRFLNYGGPLFIAKVADGSVDAVLEYQKGYFLYDLLPGLHIASNAGAVVTDLSGQPLEISDYEARYKFLISSGPALHAEILDALAARGDRHAAG